MHARQIGDRVRRPRVDPRGYATARAVLYVLRMMNGWRALLLAIVVATSSSAAAAAPSSAASAATSPAASGVPSVYRFDVAVTGADPTQKSPVTYTLVLEEDHGGEISTGSVIPLTNAPTSARESVGLSVHLHYSVRGGIVLLDGEFEMSSVDPVAGPGGATIHRVKASGIVPITPGAPALLTSANDVVSHRHYEVSVTAQKLL